MTARDWLRMGLIGQAVLAMYFQVVQWLPLGRWNYQPEDLGLNPLSNQPLLTLAASGDLRPGAVVLVIGFVVPFVIFCVGYWANVRWLMWLQVPFYAGWLAIQASWWVLYAVGRNDEQVDRYNRVFGHATQVLPSFGRHLPPDGAHFVLHVLLLWVVVCTVVGLRRTAIPDALGRNTIPA